MSDALVSALEKLEQCEMKYTALRESRAQLYVEFDILAARYDDALKRINDMQAELEYLRLEVNRG